MRRAAAKIKDPTGEKKDGVRKGRRLFLGERVVRRGAGEGANADARKNAGGKTANAQALPNAQALRHAAQTRRQDLGGFADFLLGRLARNESQNFRHRRAV